MEEKLKVMNTYKRYLESLGNKDSNLVENFRAVCKYLDDNTDEYFYVALMTNCVFNTVKAAKERNLKLRDMASDWNHSAVQEFFNLKDKAVNLKRIGNYESYKVIEYRLQKLIYEEESPHTKLYMYIKHSESEDGYEFYKHSKNTVWKLLKAKSSNEIESILSSLQEPQEETNTASPTQTTHEPREKTELFKLFNPKDLAETEACFAMAEEMFSKGELCKDDYSYVKEILLSPRRVFYKNGGTYKEPTKDSPFKKALNDDSNDELSEALASS